MGNGFVVEDGLGSGSYTGQEREVDLNKLGGYGWGDGGYGVQDWLGAIEGPA